MTPPRDALIAWVKEKRQYHDDLASPKAFVSQRLSDFHRAEAARFAALHALLVGQGWQPIETAPKDGTTVLVCCVNGKVATAAWQVTMGRSWQVAPGRFQFEELSSWFGHSLSATDVVTHWQPLPTPPPEAPWVS